MHKESDKRKQAVFTEKLRSTIYTISKHKCLPLLRTNHISVTSSAVRWKKSLRKVLSVHQSIRESKHNHSTAEESNFYKQYTEEKQVYIAFSFFFKSTQCQEWTLVCIPKDMHNFQDWDRIKD